MKRFLDSFAVWANRWAAILAAVTSAVALGFTAYQFRDGGHVQKSNLEATMQERMASLDTHFAEHPMSRRYFYDPYRDRDLDASRPRTIVPIPQSPRRANAEVLSTAEMIIDLAATVASSTELMESGTSSRWKRIFNAYYCDSQAVRYVWSTWGDAYSPATRDVLGAGPPSGRWQRPEDVGCD